ncbi:hypothetical protein ABK040_011734 [Willaertia magna]
MFQVDNLETLLDNIKTIAFQKRIRVYEFFNDFDKLRSGYVSVQQFRRCLSMCGIELSDSNFDFLVKEYLDPNINKMNYLVFSNTIDKVFTTRNMEKQPTSGTFSVSPLIETLKQPKPLRENEMEKLEVLYDKLRRECTTKGYIVKDYFKDFDPLNHGTVTKPQFLQTIPFKELNQNELMLILSRFTNDKGDVNYLQFHKEIYKNEQVDTVYQETHRYNTEEEYKEVEDTEREIKKALLKYRIKIDENFRDFDRLRTGYVTKEQFKSVLGAIKFPKMTLKDSQLELLAEKYRIEDRDSQTRVVYMDFINNMYNVFNDTGLEKFPTKQFHPQNYLVRKDRKSLDNNKEIKYNEIMKHLRRKVYTHRIMLMPFFDDFDKTKKSTYSTDHVTKTRFERALHMLGLTLTREEYDILAEKYNDLNNGDVNYKMFIEDIENGIEEEDLIIRGIHENTVKAFVNEKKTPVDRSVDEILQDITLQSLVDRIRLQEFMVDYDPLRSNEITDTQFRSALSMASINLTNNEFNGIKEQFKSSRRLGFIKYRDFCDTIDKVFTEKQMEKTPSKELISKHDFLQTTKTIKGPKVKYEKEEVDKLLQRMQSQVLTHRIILKNNFQDFDYYNRGKINKTHFIQCLDKLFSFLTHKDYELLIDSYYEESSGYVNYLQLIEDLDRSERAGGEKTLYEKELDLEMSKSFTDSSKTSKSVSRDISDVLHKIISETVKNRIGVRQFFVDFDKLRKGYVTKQKFRTALSMTKIDLSDKELDMLEKFYKIDSTGYDTHEMVSYTSFCDELERVVTEKHLEKLPTKVVQPFQPRHSYALKANLPELKNNVDEEQLEKLMHRLAIMAKIKGHILKVWFQDYDPLRKERVTKTQFTAVLDFLKFNLTFQEMDLLKKRFEDERNDVDYITFCGELENRMKKI